MSRSAGSARRAVTLALAFAAIRPLAITSPASAQQVSPDYYAGMRWRNIGPNRSGYVSAVAGIPGDPTTYYIGTPEGGVWKSGNGGTTWTPIFDEQHVASIGAVAVAPSDPNTIYVGTGNQSGWSFTPGNGVYKSVNAGRTWTKVGLRGSGYINAIIVDPKHPGTVLVASGSRTADNAATIERGVYRTTNGGRAWTRVLPADGASAASELNYDFQDPQVIYATLQGVGGGRGGGVVAAPSQPTGTAGIFKSTDGGVTWKSIGYTGLPAGTTSFPLAVASGTHGQRLYGEVRAGGRGGGSIRSGLYRSDDGGNTWTLGTTQIASAGGHVYADPVNPDVVYLMGTSMYRSLDGGRHFESYMGAPSGADIRMLWIDATNPRRMLAGADQGPTVSVDGGETWTPWYNLINGQFYRVSTDNDFPYHVCGPQQDSGTACVLSRSDFGQIRPQDWYPAGGFENGFIVADPLNPRWVYTQGWYHVLRRFDRQTSQVTVLYQPAPQDRFGGAPPLAFSPQDPHTLFMGAQYLLASSDNANTWRPISPDLTARTDQPGAAPAAGGRGGPAGGSIQALAPSPVNAGSIWVGTSNGLIQLTRDGGRNWTDVTPPDLPAGAINVLDASHSDGGTVYVALLSRDNHPHIYRTTNFGQAWQEIVAGLPDGAVVRVVREDPVNPNLLYAGTVTGAWVSFDRGDHWQSLQLNLPSTVVSDMTVKGSDLVISTYGRGFWILDDVTPLRQIREATAATTAAFMFRPDSASRARWDNTQDTPLPPEITTGENPPEGALIDYFLKAPISGPVTLTFTDAAGHLVREYSNSAPPTDTLMPNVPAYWFRPDVVLPTTEGMHRIEWDLRYADPKILPFGYTGTMLNYVEYTLNWHAIPGQTPRSTVVGPMVPPGRYTARLKVAGQTYSREVTIVPDPRVPATQADLVAQLQQEERMTAGLAASFDAFQHVERLRAALAQATIHAKGKPAANQMTAAAKALDDSVGGVQAGVGVTNRDLGRYLVDMEVGDGAPAATVVEAIDRACRDIDTDLSELRRLIAGAAPQLNTLLRAARIPPLPAWTPAAGAACATDGPITPLPERKAP